MTESKGLPESLDVTVFPKEFAHERNTSVILAVGHLNSPDRPFTNLTEIGELILAGVDANPDSFFLFLFLLSWLQFLN